MEDVNVEPFQHDQGHGSGDSAGRQGRGARERQSRLRCERRHPGGFTDIFAAKGTAAWTRAKSNVEDVVSDVSAKGQEAVDAVQEAGDRVVDAIDESLRTRPYTTLAVALGIGFLFGAMWRR